MKKPRFNSAQWAILIVVLTVVLMLVAGGVVLNNLKSASQQAKIEDNQLPSRFSPQHFVLTDQSETDQDFFQFLQKLQKAVDERDAHFIHALVTPKTQLSFGVGVTLDDLGVSNKNSPFWLHLEKAIAIGCSQYETNSNPTSISNSYNWYCPPLDSEQSKVISAFEQVFIVSEQVKVRAEPNNNSSILGIVSYEIIKFDYEGLSKLSAQQQDAIYTLYGWMPVILSNGQRGYVNSRYAYRTVGYRIWLVKSENKWQLMSFVAGD